MSAARYQVTGCVVEVVAEHFVLVGGGHGEFGEPALTGH